MKNKIVIITVIVAVLLIVGLMWFGMNEKNNEQSTSLSDGEMMVTDTQPEEEGQTQTNTHGDLLFKIPSDFGLAVNPDQLMVKSVIPPCDEGFNYCLYYNGSTYQNTNFETAGVAINYKDKILDQDTCLNTNPDGYTNLQPTQKQSSSYSVSVFSPVENAGAGHFSNGTIYRIFLNNSCYEVQTRVAKTAYGNYPTGTIKEFTPADETIMTNRLQSIVRNIRITDKPNEIIFQ